MKARPRIRLATLTAMTALLLSARSGAFAGEQDHVGSSEKQLAFGLEKGIAVPIGDWGDFAGFGLGVLGRLEYKVSPRLAVTANPGLIFRFSFFPKIHGGGTDTSNTEFLVTGGVKHSVTPKLSIRAMTGLNLRTLWGSSSETDPRIALIAGGGYQFSRAWSVGANLFIPNLLLTEAGEDVNVGILFNLSHGF